MNASPTAVFRSGKRQLLPAPEQKRLARVVGNTQWTPIKFSHRSKGEPYWLMRCACGTEKLVEYGNYKTGKSLSCGCYRSRLCAANQRGSNRLPTGESARNQLLLVYKRGAGRRNLSFELSRETFLAITSADCHYCGSPPMLVMNRAKYAGKGNGAYIYSGIDRKDPRIGYVDDNCVPCCKPCNYGKAGMSYEEFIAWLDRLVDFRAHKRSSV